jgi:hypothetical protein
VTRTLKLAVSKARLCCCICAGALSMAITPARAAGPDPAASLPPPCGELVGPGGSANGPNSGFELRDGEPVDFVSGGRATQGRLLVFRDGPVFRAYWQPVGSPEKYALANAGPHSVRLISTPPQGVPARDGKPGVMTQPVLVLSCPTL